MPSLTTEEGVNHFEAISVTPSPTFATARKSHSSPYAPSQLPSRPCPEATTDLLTSTPISRPQRPTIQTLASPQPALVSPYTSAPVTLFVGGHDSPSPETEPVAFYVHVDLLTSTSPFFRAAFGSSAPSSNTNSYTSSKPIAFTGFKESQTRTMSLPEERPDDVRYLLQWVYWKAAMSVSSTTTVRSTTTTTTEPTTSASLSPKSACPLAGLARSVGAGAGTENSALYHPLIDPRLDAFSQYNTERRLVAKAAQHGDVTQLIVPRPTPPPAFGPLIRLWLLADRLDIRGGLRDEVVERVLEVSRVGNCVPGREDVWVLWEGWGGREGKGTLRELVLDLFVGMRCWGLFAGEEGGEGKAGYGGWREWHEGFLRELVRRLMWEVHGEWKGGKRKGIEKAGDGRCGRSRGRHEDQGGEEDFVRIGRLRRRRCEYHEHM